MNGEPFLLMEELEGRARKLVMEEVPAPVGVSKDEYRAFVEMAFMMYPRPDVVLDALSTTADRLRLEMHRKDKAKRPAPKRKPPQPPKDLPQ